MTTNESHQPLTDDDFEMAARMGYPGFYCPYLSYSPSPFPVSAEQADKIIAVLEDWFQAIELGIANKRMPSLKLDKVSKERVDKLIQTIDSYIAGQLRYPQYWTGIGMKSLGKPIDTPADFNRLQGAAREAFAQDVFRTIEEVCPNDNDQT